MYTKYKIVPFCPYHFVRTILSNTILSVYHFVYTILSVPFCPLPFCTVTVESRRLNQGLDDSCKYGLGGGFMGGIRPWPQYTSVAIVFGPLQQRSRSEILGNILNWPPPLAEWLD